MVCRSGRSGGSTNLHPHVQACRCQHVDKGVDGEEVDLSAHEIGDARLSNSKLAGRGITFPPIAVRLRWMGHPIVCGDLKRTTTITTATAGPSTCAAHFAQDDTFM